MKIAYVTPRYGDEVVGGAEFAVRQLAERLVPTGTSVEVLTTCAVDARTWANHYQDGESDLRGVRVRRFLATGRSPSFDADSGPVLARPEHASTLDQERWLERQGPASHDLVEAVRTSDADLVVGSPYLFHPIVAGLRTVSDRALLHPAAHDEAPLRLPMYRALFESVRGLAFYSHAEQSLVDDRFAVGATPQIVLGLGCDPAPAPETLPADPLHLDGRPYLVCLGRVEGAKGTGTLATTFARFKDRHPGPLRLVFVGPVHDRPVAHPDVLVAGRVDEPTKWAVFRDAVALVSPSAYESFGIVLLEAWQAGTPVLVNAVSAPTRELCERSRGGLSFRDAAEFEVAVRRLVESPQLCAALSRAGQSYVATHLGWGDVIERYVRFLTERLRHLGAVS